MIFNYDNPVFYDLETSGESSHFHDIIQIGAYAPATGKEFEVKLKFNLPRSNPKSLEMNNYNVDDWQYAVMPYEAIVNFKVFLEEHADLEREKDDKEYMVAVLAGHNIALFDNKFLRAYFKAIPLFLPADFRCYDTLQLAQWVLPGRRSYSLTSLAQHYKIETTQAHDALEDAKTAALVAAKLLRSIGIQPSWASKLNYKEPVHTK